MQQSTGSQRVEQALATEQQQSLGQTLSTSLLSERMNEESQAAVKDIHTETKCEYYFHLWGHQDENVIVPTQCGPQGEGVALGGPSVVCDFRSPQQVAWPSEVSPMPVFLNPATPLLRTGPRGELHQWVGVSCHTVGAMIHNAQQWGTGSRNHDSPRDVM